MSALNDGTRAVFSQEQLYSLTRAFDLIESNPDEARSLMGTLSGFSDSKGRPVGDSWIALLDGWIAIKRGDDAGAFASFETARHGLEGSDDRWGYSRSLNAIGVVFMYQCDYNHALHFFAKALEVARLIQNAAVASSICTNIATVFMELDYWSDALRFLEMTKAYGVHDYVNIAVFKTRLAAVFTELGHYDEAEKLVAEAISLCEERGFARTEADAVGALGRLRAATGRHEEALAAFDEAIAKAEEIGNARFLADFGLRKAAILVATGRLGESVETLEKACEAARRARHKTSLAKCLSMLSARRSEARRWEDAYACLKEARDVERLVYSDEVAAKAAAMRQGRTDAENAAFRDMYERFAKVSAIGQAIASSISVEDIGRILAEKAPELIAFDSIALAGYDPESRELRFRYAVDEGSPLEPFAIPIDDGTSLAAFAVRRDQELVLDDMALESRQYVSALTDVEGSFEARGELKSAVFLPISLKGEPRGILTFQSARKGAFTPVAVEIASALAAYAGIAMENARLFDEIRHLAATDPLTGLMNRRFFLEQFRVEILRAHRYGSGTSLLILDLDHFKLVNDGYGHVAGDSVLRTVATAIVNALRNVDRVGRFGGEEFVVLLPCTDSEGARIVAERLRAAVAEAEAPDPEGGPPIRITTSIGVSSAAPDESDFEAVLKRADKALYAAKEGGRDRVMVNVP